MGDNHRSTAPFSVSHPISPYLNIDPSIFKTEPQYIMPEGNQQKRGRFEYAFSQIGGSVLVGSAIGGAQGMFAGINDKTMTEGLLTAARRTHVLNAVTKYSTSTAGALGVIALMYSAIGFGFSYGRGTDDDLNTITAGTLTGFLYKIPAGLPKAGIGAAVGLACAAGVTLLTKQDLATRVLSRMIPRW